MQLERLKLAGPIEAVRIGVVVAARLAVWQQELFAPSGHEDCRHLGLLVDRLSNRLGRNAVLRARLQPEAQPELAVRYEPLAGAAPRQPPSGVKPLPRPLLLLREPTPVEALALAPGGLPQEFCCQGRHRVARVWGPERIQTGWWRGRYVERDYYRVETTGGKQFWLFRQLPNGNWYLHGAFD